MRVNPIRNFYTPNFKEYSVESRTDKYSYRTTTRFFREDLNWDDFVYMLKQKYKDVPKVNIICNACSDGEEVYSLALKLISFLGAKEAEKFFPIVGKDIDSCNISLARNGRYIINDYELKRIENNTDLNLNRYVDINNGYCDNTVTIRDSLKEKVFFKQANMVYDADKIPPENSVILCRNVWPYLPPKEQKSFASKLYNCLEPSSLVVLGSFDTSHNIHQILENKGFEQTEIYGVLRKKEPSFIETLLEKEANEVKAQIMKIIHEEKKVVPKLFS